MPHAISPALSDPGIFSVRDAVGISGAERATPTLSVGEILHAVVVGHSRDQRTLLQIRDSSLVAESRLFFRAGDTLTVRVERLSPRIVLRLMAGEGGEISRISESLKRYRSSPNALKEMITAARELLRGELSKPSSNLLSEKEVMILNRLLDQLVITKENISTPLFLRNYIVALGLTEERRLMTAPSGRAVLKEERQAPTLKGFLRKLSSRLPAPREAIADVEGGRQRQVRQLADFTDRARQVIESFQIVNVLAKEQDGLFVLQIPFHFPDGIRMQEIFIETEAEKNRSRSRKLFRVVLFLDMDSLGTLAVDAAITEGSLRCTFRCPDHQTVGFLQFLLPELAESLSESEYRPVRVDCVLDRELPHWKQDFLHGHRLFTQNTIDVSA